MTPTQTLDPGRRGLRGLLRVLPAATPGGLILPALAIRGAPVHASFAQALLAVLIGGAAFIFAVRPGQQRPLAPLGGGIVAVAAWLLAQVSYPAAGWIVAVSLGLGIAFTYRAAADGRLLALLPPALVAVGLASLHAAAGRGPAMGAGAAFVSTSAVVTVSIAGPRPRSTFLAGGLGLAGTSLILLTAGYVGATTPRATWFGALTSHGPRNSNLVALTFDDGPDDPYTLQVRDILDARGAKATFFTVGKALDARPDIAKALLADGHLLANHSYRHDALRWLDPRYPELQAAQDAFRRNLGVCPTFFRPPHGTHTPFMARVVGDHGMRMVTWDVSGADWATDDGQQVARRVLENVRPGSIILLHDGIDGSVSADRSVLLTALPLILDGLQARGLKPVTLDRLLGAPGYVEQC